MKKTKQLESLTSTVNQSESTMFTYSIYSIRPCGSF